MDVDDPAQDPRPANNNEEKQVTMGPVDLRDVSIGCGRGGGVVRTPAVLLITTTASSLGGPTSRHRARREHSRPLYQHAQARVKRTVGVSP